MSVVEHSVSSVVTAASGSRSHGTSTLPRALSAGAGDRVKPPIKTKPAIMKKPTRTSENASPVRTKEGISEPTSSAEQP